MFQPTTLKLKFRIFIYIAIAHLELVSYLKQFLFSLEIAT